MATETFEMATIKTTNARRRRAGRADLGALRLLLEEANSNAWAIGGMVNRLKADRGLKVKDIAVEVGASRQRLSELRRTAAAFPEASRRLDMDFHFRTVAARAAKRMRLSPVAVLDEIIERRIDSTRQATRYLAERVREREARRLSKALTGDATGSTWSRCLRADFRDVLPSLPAESVKLILADAPYGTYGMYKDGRHTRVTPARRDCDGMTNEAARQLVVELFRLASLLMAEGGCLVLFRPGGLADPPWVLTAAEEFGWTCRHAVTWQRGAPKLGNGRAPYAPASERLLVFARGDEPLVNHDGSARSDVIQLPATLKSYVRTNQHLFEKPVELMERLVAKHTFPGDVVVEPFGGAAPGCVAAARLNRKWLYVESNRRNYELGNTHLAQELTKLTSPAA